MIALSAHDLTVSFGAVPILHGLDASFKAGQWTAIVGPNGAGKSTLLKALAGLIPAQGTVNLFAQPLAALPLKQKAQQLAWLGQSSHTVADGLTVYDTVMLGRLPYQSWLDSPSQADHAAVLQALQQTQALAWRERLLTTLSGGERQRVLLARVLAVQAPVVLMDEPLANLDPPHQADWVNTVKWLAANGTAVISVLHEINVALLADSLLVMAAGKVAFAGSCADSNAHRAVERVFEQRLKVVEYGGGVHAQVQLAVAEIV
jgi:iron complex transport system ATP-binding protein